MKRNSAASASGVRKSLGIGIFYPLRNSDAPKDK
jgi:hypothetical protein